MEIEELRRIVEHEIKEIHLERKLYRCHEVARVLALRLKQLGINATVRDGEVVYDFPSLIKGDWEEFLEEYFSGVKDELLAQKKRSYLHSWCEIDGSPNGVIIIDYHCSFSLNENIFWQELLIVDYKNNLPHDYYYNGVNLGKWILFRGFPPRIARLRI